MTNRGTTKHLKGQHNGTSTPGLGKYKRAAKGHYMNKISVKVFCRIYMSRILLMLKLHLSDCVEDFVADFGDKSASVTLYRLFIDLPVASDVVVDFVCFFRFCC